MAVSLHTNRLDEEEIAVIYHRHVDTVYRICYSFMKNASDAEDMVQETFLKLIASGKMFQSENHEKAWLIVTASNTCRDALKHWSRKMENIEDYQLSADELESTDDGMMDAVLRLPANYKETVYLYYYEGYQTTEIAGMLHRPESTVRSWLSRARKLLKKYYSGGAEYDEKRSLQSL